MDRPLRVRVVERPRHRPQDAPDLEGLEPSLLLQDRLERRALEQLHHEVVVTHVEDRDDVRVVEAGGRLGLAVEAPHVLGRLGALEELRLRALDGDGPPSEGIEAAVDATHRALAEELEHLVAPEGTVRGGGQQPPQAIAGLLFETQQLDTDAGGRADRGPNDLPGHLQLLGPVGQRQEDVEYPAGLGSAGRLQEHPAEADVERERADHHARRALVSPRNEAGGEAGPHPPRDGHQPLQSLVPVGRIDRPPEDQVRPRALQLVVGEIGRGVHHYDGRAPRAWTLAEKPDHLAGRRRIAAVDRDEARDEGADDLERRGG